MTDATKRRPVINPWTRQVIPQASSITPAVIIKVLSDLDAIRSHAERAPNPSPDRVAQHGERAVLISSFAMIRLMADEAIDKIEQETGWTVADVEAADTADAAADDADDASEARDDV